MSSIAVSVKPMCAQWDLSKGIVQATLKHKMVVSQTILKQSWLYAWQHCLVEK